MQYTEDQVGTIVTWMGANGHAWANEVQQDRRTGRIYVVQATAWHADDCPCSTVEDGDCEPHYLYDF